MKPSLRPAVISLLASLIVAALFAIPAISLAANSADVAALPSSGNDFLSGPIAVAAAYTDGPVFSNPQPSATSNQYALISVNYSDPDGIELTDVAYKPKFWFDDYDATRCTSGTARPGIIATETGISWDHTVVTEWGGATGCKPYATTRAPMTEGPHTVRVQVWDQLGNSSTFEWTVIFDRTPPAVTSAPLCGTYVSDTTPTISFDYGDDSGIDTSSVQLKIDNVAAVTTAGATSVVYDSGLLSEGSHALSLSLNDTLGLSTTFACSIIIDSQPPVIDPTTPADGSRASINQLIHAGWSDSGAGINQYSLLFELDGADVTSGSTADQYGASYQAHGLALGSHAAHVRVSDKSGRSTDRTWSFNVETDDTPPVVSAPADMNIEAVNAGGAAATFSASTLDDFDGPVATSCTPASGTVFPIGTTPVSCSATDASGNTGTGSFNVIVSDTTAPVVMTPPDTTTEATSAAGAVVWFTPANATDAVGVVYMNCSYAPGAEFPIGTTPVGCTAADAAGNTGTGSFNVIVRDTTAPVVTVPSDINAATSSPSGATVSFKASAIDIVGVAAIDCSPVSGSTFPVGTTPVTCTATDAAGNAGAGTFNVSVKDSTIDPGVTVFTDPTPAIATHDNNAAISIYYSDTDGISAAGGVYNVELWYDDYWVTECDGASLSVATGFKIYGDHITWNHNTVTERGATRCRIRAYEKQPMTDGSHVVRVQVRDGAGELTDYQWTFSVDHNPPTITPPALCGTISESNAPNISYAYNDISGIDTASVAMYIDNVWTSATGGAAAVNYTPAPLSDGPHKIKLDVADFTGNSASDECYFTVDTQPPAITSVSPADGGRSDTAPILSAAWTDDGAGIDQYTAYLELDGVDVTSQATIDEYGASFQTYGLALGTHNAKVGITDKTGKAATRAWSFTAAEPISYFAPWYDSSAANSMNGNWIVINNQDVADAAVDIYIGGQKMTPPAAMADAGNEHFLVKGNSRIAPQFANTTNGPVKIISTTGAELLVSQRVIFKDSFNEVMATRESDLDSEYRFTWYDSDPANGMHGNWILVGNADNTDATVDVYIAGQHKATLDIAPGGIKEAQFANETNGPVQVKSRGGQKLIVSQRVIFKDSFTEVMGTPVSQLDDEYYFTWYDSKPENSMRGNWVLVSNENASAAAYVYIDIGGQRMSSSDQYQNPYPGSFQVPEGGIITPQFPNMIDGPVKVTCASCQQDGGKIMASQRVIFKDSFEEVQGTSPALMGTSAVFPWYDLQSWQMRGDWILAGNDSSMPATVNISIGGTPMMNAATASYGFSIGGFDNITPSFPNRMDGPVNVNCTNCAGQKLIVSQRVIYLNSFNEIVGRPPRTP